MKEGPFCVVLFFLSLNYYFRFMCFCRTTKQLLDALDGYTQDATVLAPSAWDPTIRLEPPKNAPTLDSRRVFLSHPPRHYDITALGAKRKLLLITKLGPSPIVAPV